MVAPVPRRVNPAATPTEHPSEYFELGVALMRGAAAQLMGEPPMDEHDRFIHDLKNQRHALGLLDEVGDDPEFPRLTRGLVGRVLDLVERVEARVAVLESLRPGPCGSGSPWSYALDPELRDPELLRESFDGDSPILPERAPRGHSPQVQRFLNSHPVRGGRFVPFGSRRAQQPAEG